MKKKILAVFLSLCMAMSLLPVTALAADAAGEKTPSTQATTLPEAENGVITLKQDVEIASLTLEEGETIIDLNGHTLTCTWAQGLVIGKGKTLTFKDTSVSGAERGGNLVFNGVTSTTAAIAPEAGGTVNVSNLKVTCSGSAFYPAGDAAAVNITSCDVTASVYCVATNAATKENYGVKIDLKGSKFTSNAEGGDNCPVMINVPGTLIMENCEVTGDRMGVLVRAGDATISNCTIKATGEYTDNHKYESSDAWGSGNEVPMAAIIVGSKNGSYNKNATCEISNTDISQSNTNKPAVYVSSNKSGAYSSQLTISGEETAINGNVVVADGSEKTPAAVVITDSATVDGSITNNSSVSSVAVIGGATLTGEVKTNEKSGPVYVEGNENSSTGVAMNERTGLVSKDLNSAITAAQDKDTITLLQNIDKPSELKTGTTSGSNISLLSITKSVTIDGNGYGITITMPKEAIKRSQAISVGSTNQKNITVILDDVDLTINGRGADTDKGDAIDVWATLDITNGSTVTMKGVANGFVMQGGMDAKVNVSENSFVTADGVSGHFSNGGVWSITNSTVDIANCGTHGLSVEEVTIDNSAVTVTGAGYTGLYGNEIKLVNGADVTVENCGTSTAFQSNDTYKEKGAVQLKAVKEDNGTLTITDSTLTLTGNSNGATTGEQTIYVGNATVDINDGSNVYAQIKSADGAATQYYTVVFKNENGEDQSKIVASTSEPISLPDLPDQGYNHFVGWTDGTTTYDANTQVKIEKDTIFTAVWTYIPPANPNYRIDIPDFENGTVTADPAAAKAGATVTLTATPDEGYAVGSLTVTDRFGDAVKVTENADGTYTFTMPNGQVTVSATFVETQEPAPAEPFPDVDENDWFYDEVVYVYENGLMNGVENNQFAPNTATNRAMLATILYRLAGQPDVSGDLPFTDVAAGTWYTDAVLWAAQNGIVNGLGENTFAPMNTLTREQLVTMLYRYAEAEGYDVSAAADLSGYPDAGKVQPYAQEAMTWAVAEGIVEGMDGNLNPAGHATRAQIATILMRFCEGVAK